LPGYDQEAGGIIRNGAKLLYAFSEATVPKINIILRKSYGGAYIAMNSKQIGADFVFAWPRAEIAVMGSEGAVEILFGKEIAKDATGEAKKRYIKEYEERYLTPLHAAKSGYVDEIIAPEETATKIIVALDILKNKVLVRPYPRKHGNIPL
jgi:acetyl-CoA carboxylase carboxyltransferase component